MAAVLIMIVCTSLSWMTQRVVFSVIAILGVHGCGSYLDTLTTNDGKLECLFTSTAEFVMHISVSMI